MTQQPESSVAAACGTHLTQFFLFFFLFLASASMLEPTLEWLVALLMLLTLSEECCLRMRRSGGCGWLPLLPAEERQTDGFSVDRLLASACWRGSVPVLSPFGTSSGVLMTPLMAAWATAFCFFSSSMVFLRSFSSVSCKGQRSDKGQPQAAIGCDVLLLSSPSALLSA